MLLMVYRFFQACHKCVYTFIIFSSQPLVIKWKRNANPNINWEMCIGIKGKRQKHERIKREGNHTSSKNSPANTSAAKPQNLVNKHISSSALHHTQVTSLSLFNKFYNYIFDSCGVLLLWHWWCVCRSCFRNLF